MANIKHIDKYRIHLDLPQKTMDMLNNNQLYFERIRGQADTHLEQLILKLKALECWNKETSYSDEEYRTVLGKEGLRADGMILKRTEFDIGYCFGFNIHHEKNKKLPGRLQSYLKRTNWPSIMDFLNTYTPHHFSTDDVWEIGDYGIKDLSLRNHGLGRLIMRYTLDNVLLPNAIAIGFIDTDNPASLAASMRAGRFIATELIPDPYGGLSTLLTFYYPGMMPIWKDNIINPKENFISQVKEQIGKLDTINGSQKTPGKIVGYNSANKQYQSAILI